MIREAQEQQFTISVPGSICLFGEELAPVGLRTIQMAINMRVHVRARTMLDRVYRVESAAENRLEEFDPVQCVGQPGLTDPFRRAVDLLGREGLTFERGCRFEIDTEIPPESGLGYGAAVMVAWVTALLQLCDKLADAPALQIARTAYEAAGLDEARPVWMAEYLASAAGGVHVIEHGEEPKMTPVPRAIEGIVIAHADLAGLPELDMRSAIDTITQAERRLKELDPPLDFAKSSTDDIIAALQKLPDDLARAAYAVAVDRDTTEEACRLLTEEVFDQDAFGEVLDIHHEMLRDHLGIAVPQIDRLIEMSRLAGALGGKLNVPGGCTATIYAPGRTQPVLAALREAGARPYVVTKTHGVAFEDL